MTVFTASSPWVAIYRKKIFQIFCRQCRKLIYEDGVEIDTGATFIMDVGIFQEDILDIAGICENCHEKGYRISEIVGRELLAVQFYAMRRVSADEIPIYEVMLS